MFPASVQAFLNNLNQEPSAPQESPSPKHSNKNSAHIKHTIPPRFKLLSTFRNRNHHGKHFGVTCFRTFHVPREEIQVLHAPKRSYFLGRGASTGKTTTSRLFGTAKESAESTTNEQDSASAPSPSDGQHSAPSVTVIGTTQGLLLIFNQSELVKILDCCSIASGMSGVVGGITSVDYRNNRLLVACDNGDVQLWGLNVNAILRSEGSTQSSSATTSSYFKSVFTQESIKHTAERPLDIYHFHEPNKSDAPASTPYYPLIVRWLKDGVIAMACFEDLYVLQLSRDGAKFSKRSRVSIVAAGRIIDLQIFHPSHVDSRGNVGSMQSIYNWRPGSMSDSQGTHILIAIATPVRFVVMKLSSIASSSLQLSMVNQSEVTLDSLDSCWSNYFAASSSSENQTDSARNAGVIPLPYFHFTEREEKTALCTYCALGWGRKIVVLKFLTLDDGTIQCTRYFQYELSSGSGLFPSMVIAIKWISPELIAVVVSNGGKHGYSEKCSFEVHLLDPHHWCAQSPVIAHPLTDIQVNVAHESPQTQPLPSALSHVAHFERIAHNPLLHHDNNPVTPPMKRVTNEEDGQEKLVYVASSMRRKKRSGEDKSDLISLETQSRLSSALASRSGRNVSVHRMNDARSIGRGGYTHSILTNSGSGGSVLQPAPSFHSHIDFYEECLFLVTNDSLSPAAFTNRDIPVIECLSLVTYRQKIHELLAHHQWERIFDSGKRLLHREERAAIGLSSAVLNRPEKTIQFVKEFFSNILLHFSYVQFRSIAQLSQQWSVDDMRTLAKRCITFAVQVRCEDMLYNEIFDMFRAVKSPLQQSLKEKEALQIFGECLVDHILDGTLLYMDERKIHWIIDLVHQDWKKLEEVLVRVTESHSKQNFAMQVRKLGQDFELLSLYTHASLLIPDKSLYKETFCYLKEQLENRLNVRLSKRITPQDPQHPLDLHLAHEEHESGTPGGRNSIFFDTTTLCRSMERLLCGCLALEQSEEDQKFSCCWEMLNLLWENEMLFLNIFQNATESFFLCLRDCWNCFETLDFEEKFISMVHSMVQLVLRYSLHEDTHDDGPPSHFLFFLSEMLVRAPQLRSGDVTKNSSLMKSMLCHILHRPPESSSREDLLLGLIDIMSDDIFEKVFCFEAELRSTNATPEDAPVEQARNSLTSLRDLTQSSTTHRPHTCTVCHQSILSCARAQGLNHFVVMVLRRSGSKEIEVNHIASRILSLSFGVDIDSVAIQNDTHLLLAFHCDTDIEQQGTGEEPSKSHRSMFTLLTELFSRSKSLLSALYLEEFIQQLTDRARDRSTTRGTTISSELKEFGRINLLDSQFHRIAISVSVFIIRHISEITKVREFNSTVTLNLSSAKSLSETRLLLWIRQFEKEIDARETLELCAQIPSVSAFMHSVMGQTSEVVKQILMKFDEELSSLVNLLKGQYDYCERSLLLRLQKDTKHSELDECSVATHFDCQYVCFLIFLSRTVQNVSTQTALGQSVHRFQNVVASESFAIQCTRHNLPTPQNWNGLESFLCMCCDMPDESTFTDYLPSVQMQSSTEESSPMGSVLFCPQQLSLLRVLHEAKERFSSLSSRNQLSHAEKQEMWFTVSDHLFLQLRAIKYGLLHEEISPKCSPEESLISPAPDGVSYLHNSIEAVHEEVNEHLDEMDELKNDLLEVDEEEEREWIIERIEELDALVEASRERLRATEQVSFLRQMQVEQLQKWNGVSHKWNKMHLLWLQLCLTQCVRLLVSMMREHIEPSTLLQRIIGLHSLDPFFMIRPVVTLLFEDLEMRVKSLSQQRHFHMCDSFQLSTQLLNHSKRAMRWKQNWRCCTQERYCCTLCGLLLEDEDDARLWKCGHILHDRCLQTLRESSEGEWSGSCPVCGEAWKTFGGSMFNTRMHSSDEEVHNRLQRLEGRNEECSEYVRAFRNAESGEDEHPQSNFVSEMAKQEYHVLSRQLSKKNAEQDSNWFGGVAKSKSALKDDAILRSLLRKGK